MDDLAWSIYEYLLDESTDFQGEHIVLLPITVIARKFDRNHRTISRRLSALRDEGLIKTIIKKHKNLYLTIFISGLKNV